MGRRGTVGLTAANRSGLSCHTMSGSNRPVTCVDGSIRTAKAEHYWFEEDTDAFQVLMVLGKVGGD